MVQDPHFTKWFINIQHSIYKCCKVYHLKIKQEVRETGWWRRAGKQAALFNMI